MHLFWNINQEGLQHAKCCKEERHLFVDFFLTATELTVMLATAFPLFKGNGMAGVTDPTAKGTALAQERRAQLEPDVCSPFNYLLPVESFSWSCGKGFFASRVERLGFRAKITAVSKKKEKTFMREWGWQLALHRIKQEHFWLHTVMRNSKSAEKSPLSQSLCLRYHNSQSGM